MSFEWKVRVYWEDTDAGGVVFYANYLKFLERARTEWVRAIGFDQSRLAEQTGVVMVVRRVECDFIASARLDDELVVSVEVKPEDVRGARFHVTQSVRRMSDDALLLTAAVDIASLRASSWKPVRLPRALAEAMQRP